MDLHALIATFRRLPTNDARRNAIEAIFHELTPYELRHLHSLTAQRSFQYDIIGELPLELVSQVFAYLEPSTPHRLQSVSRNWQHRLRSLHVLKKSLDAWYEGSRSLVDADHDRCLQLAKDVHAFRHGGKPHKAFELTLAEPDCRLVGDVLIWGLDRMLYLYNMRSGTLDTLCGEAREQVSRIFASNELVGFVAPPSTCYVFDLLTRERRKFRMPNYAFFYGMDCRDRTVACTGHNNNNNSEITIYIWEYDIQKGTSFTIRLGSYLLQSIRIPKHALGISENALAVLLLQPKDRCIIVFTHTWDDDFYIDDDPINKDNDMSICSTVVPPRIIRFSTFDYNGNVVREGECILDDINAPSGSSFASPPSTSVSTRDIHRFNLFEDADERHPVLGTATCNLFFQFDAHRYQFTMPRSHSNVWWESHRTFWWRDTFFTTLDRTYYQGDHDLPKGVLLVNTGSSEKSCCKVILSGTWGGDTEDYSHEVLINDTYVVRVGEEGVQVLCYDSTFELPLADGPFFDLGTFRTIPDEELAR